MKADIWVKIATAVLFVFLAFLYVMVLRNVQGLYLNKVAVQKSRKDLDKYREILNKSLSFNPNLSQGHIDLANTFIQTGQYEKAINHILEASDTGMLKVSANEAFGVIYMKKEKLDEAEKLLKTALIQSPGNPEILEYLALANINRQDFDTAMNYLDRATRLDPARPNSYFLYGKIYETRERQDRKYFEKKLDYYRRALQCYREDERLLFNPEILKKYVQNQNAYQSGESP